MILDRILIVYPHIILLIEICQLLRNYMRDEAHNIPFVSGLTAINGVCKSVFCILDEIMIYVYQRL